MLVTMLVLVMGMTLLLPENLPWQLLFAVGVDVQLSGRNTAAIHPRNLQACSDIQFRDRLFKQPRRHSCVHQRAQKHVAADTGKTVEVRYPHRSVLVDRWSFLVCQPLKANAVAPHPSQKANDERPVVNFHHREAFIRRQTSPPRAVCYNHSFLQ